MAGIAPGSAPLVDCEDCGVVCIAVRKSITLVLFDQPVQAGRQFRWEVLSIGQDGQ